MLSFCGLAKRINAHGKAKSKEEGYEEEGRKEEWWSQEGCQEEGYEEERAKETLICFSVNPRAVAPKSRRVRNERTIFQKATEPNLKWGVPSTGRLIFFWQWIAQRVWDSVRACSGFRWRTFHDGSVQG